MGTSLATKQDLEILRRDVENRFALVDEKFAGLGARMDQKIDTLRSDLARDLASLELKMTVKLGSLIAAGVGLTIAALRVWT